MTEMSQPLFRVYDTITHKIINCKYIEIMLVPMGVLAPVSAHMGPSAQPPIGTSGNYQARMSAESISPNFPIFRSK